MEAVQPAAAAETSNILHTVRQIGTSLSNANELLHRLSLLIPPAEVTLASGFPHQFRDGSLLTPGAGVKGIPELLIEVELCSPHDVYYTSPEIRMVKPKS
jgi:hypothetical protein